MAGRHGVRAEAIPARDDVSSGIEGFMVPPAERLVEILPGLERAVALLPSALHLQTDKLTGFYLKNLLYSAEGRAIIDAAIPGEKRFIFLDCQHAGAANSHGAGARIDAYFGALGGVVERLRNEFNTEIVPIRLGGDEFALIVSSDERTEALMHRLVVEIEKSRMAHVGPVSTELCAFVAERDSMRAVRNGYRRFAESAGEPFSAEGFRRYLGAEFLAGDPGSLSEAGFANYCAERGLDGVIRRATEHEGRHPGISRAIECGFLQRYVAEGLAAGMSAPAGRFSMGSVELGRSPRWEDYHLAEGSAAKRVQATKHRVHVLEIDAAQPLDRTLRVKHHEELARDTFLAREGAYREARRVLETPDTEPAERAAALYRTVMLAVADPSVPGVVRGQLVGDLSSEVLLGGIANQPLSCLRVNVHAFGVVNNSKSYAEADQMLGEVVAVASAAFGPIRVVRHGGGLPVLVGRGSFGVDDLVPLREKLNQTLARHIDPVGDGAAYARMLVEYGERFALSSRWREGRFVVPEIAFGTCDVALASIKVERGQPLKFE
jgi:GGDEF domain-containing protein